MNTKVEFYMNENGTPIFEIGYQDGERYFLMPFRGVNFQVSMNSDGFGSAGNSSNMYFSDVRNCMGIGMNHCDGYWTEDFAIETMRKIIVASAREAIFDHFHCSYGSKHKDSMPEVVSEVYGFDRNSSWNKFIVACYEHFGVKTKWDE
jgi:hypothetical protein